MQQEYIIEMRVSGGYDMKAASLDAEMAQIMSPQPDGLYIVMPSDPFIRSSKRPAPL
jgi:hypothetical protein